MKMKEKIMRIIQLSYCMAIGMLMLPVVLTGCSSSVNSLTLEVKNIYFPDYHETIQTTMGSEEYVGDTDYSFKAVKFYPTFSIIDSSKKIVSLSDEPKNPAFQIDIYEKGKLVEETWAFYGALAPHFSSSSFLMFRVSAFEYKGKKYGGTGESKETEQ